MYHDTACVYVACLPAAAALHEKDTSRDTALTRLRDVVACLFDRHSLTPPSSSALFYISSPLHFSSLSSAYGFQYVLRRICH